MDPAYYVAAGSLKARSMQMDVVANNLANSSTVGYKTERSFFQVFNRAATEGRGLPLSKDVNDGAIVAMKGVDFSQGATTPTGRSLDLALEGDGFFMVQTPQGLRATRDGRFTLATNGQLEAVDGAPLMGKNGQPIRLDPAAGNPSIDADGNVTQAGNALGQLDLRAYADASRLSRTGTNRYDPGNAAQVPAKAKVQQGSLEQSGVDVASAMVDMIRINRLFEMSMKVASTVTNDLDSRSISDIANSR